MSDQAESKEVFVSHSHKQDAGPAHRLARDLEKRGHRPWIAPDSILPGEQWVKGINRGLTQSDVLVVVMTPAALESEWVNLEVEVGIQRAMSKGKLFIPLVFQSCTVPELWSAFQYISFQKSYQEGLKDLLARLSGKPAWATVRSGGKPARLVVPKQAIRNSKLAANLMNAAANSSITTISRPAPPYLLAQNIRFGKPQSDVFHFNAAGNKYVGQVFGKGIAYAKAGDWRKVNLEKVKLLEKPEGL